MAMNKTSSTGFGTGTGNQTLLMNPGLCTIDTCELNMSNFDYIPTLAGNAVVTAIFVILLCAQLFFGIRHKTWGFMAAMFLGILLEIIGYIGRIFIHNNPFNGDAFLQSLVCLTIAPALLTAAIYLCLGRVVHLYGTHLSYFKPGTYTIVFCTFDFICLLLQAAGGAIASTANTRSNSELGRKIMLAGLIFQVIAIFIFMAVGIWFGVNVYKGRGSWNNRYTHITHSWLFKGFVIGLSVAVVTIQARSLFRVAELKDGFNSDLFKGHEDVFMTMEAAMIIIACTCLSAFHPGTSFQGAWADANFKFRSNKASLLKTVDSGDEEMGRTVELRGTDTGYRAA